MCNSLRTSHIGVSLCTVAVRMYENYAVNMVLHFYLGPDNLFYRCNWRWL